MRFSWEPNVRSSNEGRDCFFQIVVVVFVSFRGVPEARCCAACRRQIVFDGERGGCGRRCMGEGGGGGWTDYLTECGGAVESKSIEGVRG